MDPENFDIWNNKKKDINLSMRKTDFHEREIWWCSIGVNIGSEQNSLSTDFSRPVLIVKKFTPTIFWGIPMTTKIKNIPFRFLFETGGVYNDLLILQMRTFDHKRLLRKVTMMPKAKYEELLQQIRSLV